MTKNNLANKFINTPHSREGCAYCFRTLDPQDPLSTHREFVICSNCHAAYHKGCFDRVCTICEDGHAERIDIPPITRLIVENRRPDKSLILSSRKRSTLFFLVVLLGLSTFCVMSLCFIIMSSLALVSSNGTPNSEVTTSNFYLEDFDNIGTWPQQDTFEAAGDVSNGKYVFNVKEADQFFWATGGETFGDGTYEVEATAVAGPENNGFGMMFFINNDTNDFYSFEVSSDGYVLVARCTNACEDYQALLQSGWFQSPAVKTGLNQTNVLKVEANGGTLSFLVNGQKVGTVTDTTLTSGDIAVAVETFEEGGVIVNFDNFKFTPSTID